MCDSDNIFSCTPLGFHAFVSLRRMQRKMLRIVLPIRVIAGETPESFARRSGRIVSHVQRMVGPWGALWACRVISWAGHVLRDTKGLCWSARILDVRSSAELSARRSLNSNRPKNRKQSGWSNRRWRRKFPNVLGTIYVGAPERAYLLWCRILHFYSSFVDTCQFALGTAPLLHYRQQRAVVAECVKCIL